MLNLSLYLILDIFRLYLIPLKILLIIRQMNAQNACGLNIIHLYNVRYTKRTTLYKVKLNVHLFHMLN